MVWCLIQLPLWVSEQYNFFILSAVMAIFSSYSPLLSCNRILLNTITLDMGLSNHLPSHSRSSFSDNIYYIPVSTTLFPAGTVCCLGLRVLTNVPPSGPVFSYNHSFMYLAYNLHVNGVDSPVFYILLYKL
jgi:hypothetical protein